MRDKSIASANGGINGARVDIGYRIWATKAYYAAKISLLRPIDLLRMQLGRLHHLLPIHVNNINPVAFYAGLIVMRKSERQRKHTPVNMACTLAA